MTGEVWRTAFTVEVALRAAFSARPLRTAVTKPVDLFLCVTDHFEPQHAGQPGPAARARLEEWLRLYPQVAARHQDAEGRPPAHGFFYPWDEYDEWEFSRLAELCAAGWGEVELHLHHADDTESDLRRKLREAVSEYRRHGTLSRRPDGRGAFGFIHGNWALDNSRCEHGQNFCGVNNELDVLRDEGCYADFTFPSWKHVSQPRQVNSIFYAVDDPARPKSYDRGAAARVGNAAPEGLLIVQGPLVPYRRGLRAAMDDPDLANCPGHRYSPERLDRWVRAGLCVQGRPDRIFIKLHCHGCADQNRLRLLEHDLPALFEDAERRYNDGVHYRLHYVTARELFNVIKATEARGPEEIADARDWLLPPPGESAGGFTTEAPRHGEEGRGSSSRGICVRESASREGLKVTSLAGLRPSVLADAFKHEAAPAERVQVRTKRLFW